MDVRPTTTTSTVEHLLEANPPEAQSTIQSSDALRSASSPVVLRKLVLRPDGESELVRIVDDEITELRQKIVELTERVAAMAEENAQLTAARDELLARLEETSRRTVPVDGCYTMDQFLWELNKRMHRSYGWRTDYIAATQAADGCQKATAEMVHRWQVRNKVPAWAVEELDRLTFPPRKGKGHPRWSEADERFVLALYRDNPTMSYAEMARRCAESFGREISEGAVKGVIFRAREQHGLSRQRKQRA